MPIKKSKYGKKTEINFIEMQTKTIISYIKEQFKTGGMIKKIILANTFVFALLLILKVLANLFLANDFFKLFFEHPNKWKI